jgi:hypothetical protein
MLSYAQSQQLAERDKFFIKYGIALGLAASVTPELADDSRIDQVYQNRLRLNKKNGIRL